MPLTQIDSVAALIVIDLQKGITALVPELAPAVVANSVKLIEAFRSRNLPVVLVNVAGGAPGRTGTPRHTGALPPDWADLEAALNQQPTDILITKKSFGAFINTALDEELKKRNVTQVVFCGIATSIGIESSARSAYDLGYNVAFVEDAMADLRPDAHNHSIEVFFPRIGEIDTTESTVKLLRS